MSSQSVHTLHCRCEQALISVVAVRNCIKLYQTSEEHSAENLKKYCLQIISSHWVSRVYILYTCSCRYMFFLDVGSLQG